MPARVTEVRNTRNSARITAPLTRRSAEQRAPQAGAELRPEDGYLQLVTVYYNDMLVISCVSYMSCVFMPVGLVDVTITTGYTR